MNKGFLASSVVVKLPRGHTTREPPLCTPEPGPPHHLVTEEGRIQGVSAARHRRAPSSRWGSAFSRAPKGCCDPSHGLLCAALQRGDEKHTHALGRSSLAA